MEQGSSKGAFKGSTTRDLQSTIYNEGALFDWTGVPVKDSFKSGLYMSGEVNKYTESAIGALMVRIGFGGILLCWYSIVSVGLEGDNVSHSSAASIRVTITRTSIWVI